MAATKKVTREVAEHTNAGRSIIEMYWEQADAQYAKLVEMEVWTAEDLVNAFDEGSAVQFDEDAAEEVVAFCQQQGKLATLAWCIAKMINPYADIKEAMDRVKAEIRERWEAENPEEDESEEDDTDEEDED